MMEEKRIQTCSEIYCLLNYFPKSYIDKLPIKLLNLIKQNSNSKYFIEVNPTKSLEEQEIMEDTKNTLVVLKCNYWSDELEKRNIIKRLNKNEKKYEEELRERYNPDNLFKNKDTKVGRTQNSFAMVEYKESIFIKLKNWFKHFFNK